MCGAAYRTELYSGKINLQEKKVEDSDMGCSKEVFGVLSDGRQVEAYILENGKGTKGVFLNLGAIWNRMIVADRNGEWKDVILGFDSPEPYLTDDAFFGAIVGRNANRIGGGKFTLEGTTYQMAVNNGPNNLHSGTDFYRNRIWNASAKENQVTFSLVSEDGDQGFPGKAQIQVTYTLGEDDSVSIEYEMTADKTTIANFTNHCYFNLAGQDSRTILDQKVRILAESFTPTDAGSIPTGEIRKVEGTPMDLRQFKAIGQEIDSDYDQLRIAKGYDHNWVLDDYHKQVRLAAEAKAEETGICLEVYTDLPGIQFYTGNYIGEGIQGKDGAKYGMRAGYCFETQYFPDAVNHENFPSPVLQKGETYHTVTSYRFSVK